MSADVVRVPSLGSPQPTLHRSAGRTAVTAAIVLALAAGGFGTRDLKAQTVSAEAARAEPPKAVAAWCLQRNDSNEPPICAYETFPSCFVAGFKEGGYCISNPGPAAAPVPPTDQAARRRVTRSAPPPPPNGVSSAPSGQQAAPAQPAAQAPRQRKLTAAEREKIFNDFQRWREQRGEPKSEQRASTRGQQ